MIPVIDHVIGGGGSKWEGVGLHHGIHTNAAIEQIHETIRGAISKVGGVHNKHHLFIVLARLHLHNISLRTAGDEATPMYSDGYVDRFGFSSTTCCGFIPQNNEWACTWTVCMLSSHSSPD